MAGIGRVSSTDMYLKAQSDGMVTISNASGIGDGEYLIFGHDNGDISDYITTESPDSNVERLGGNGGLLKPVTSGTITLAFDPANVGGSPTAGFTEYALMIDSDGNFASGATFVPLTLNGSQYEANNVNLANGDYFTFCVVKPVIQFTYSASNGVENSSPASIEISLNHPISQNVSVTATQTGGTATEGTDYSYTDGIVTITAGATTVNTNITITNDFQVETDETVVLTISAPTVGNLGTNTVHTFSINDDDNARKANFVKSDSSNTEDNSPILFDVFLNLQDAINPSQIYYTVSGTASR